MIGCPASRDATSAVVLAVATGATAGASVSGAPATPATCDQVGGALGGMGGGGNTLAAGWNDGGSAPAGAVDAAGCGSGAAAGCVGSALAWGRASPMVSDASLIGSLFGCTGADTGGEIGTVGGTT
jgi:hypothetical protein